MAHILKILKGVVQFIAVLITVAFIVNSLTGITSMVNMIDNEGVSVQDINPGDFTLNYEDLHIEIGITINNSGIYDMESVQLSLKCDLKSNVSEDWHEVINTTSSLGGVTIASSEVKNIDISADLIDFSKSPAEIAAQLGISDPNWDFSDLLNTDFEIRVFLTFTISYAFGQYDITISIEMPTEDLEVGF